MASHADVAVNRPTWCKVEEKKYGSVKAKGKRSRAKDDVGASASPSKKRKVAKKEFGLPSACIPLDVAMSSSCASTSVTLVCILEFYRFH